MVHAARTLVWFEAAPMSTLDYESPPHNRPSLYDRLFGRAMLTIGDQAIVSLATFATNTLVNRVSKEEAGLYALAFSLWVLLSEVHNSLVSTPHMIRVPKVKGTRLSVYNGSTLIHQLLLSGALTVLILLAANVAYVISMLEGSGKLNVFYVLLATAAGTIPMTFRNYARNFCFALGRTKSVLWLDVGVTVIQLAAIGILLTTQHLTAVNAILVLGAANAISAFIWFRASRGSFQVVARAASATAKRNWQMGKWLFASSMMWVAGFQIYPWVISGIKGSAEAGIYFACSTIAAFGNPLVTALQNYFGPSIAHAHAEKSSFEFRNYVIKCTAQFVVLVLPIAILMSVFAELLLKWLMSRHGGADYAGNGPAVAVIVFAVVVQSASFCFSRALFCLGYAKLDTYTNLAPIGVLLTFGVWAVYAHGALGAAVALLVSQSIGFLIRGAAFLRVSQLPPLPKTGGAP
jgi:O-antigen/teichoic acid export membrane protein